MDYKLFINFVFLSEVVLLAGFAEATPIPPTEQIEDTVGGVPSTYDSQMFEELRNDESEMVKGERWTRYLTRFGYMGPGSADPRMANIKDPSVMTKALERFQKMAGIPVTGKMDDKTKQMMTVPRCGVKDNTTAYDSMKRRRKRYAIQGSKWSRNNLKYRISTFSGGQLNNAHQLAIMERAFQVWADVTPLTFTNAPTGNVDIDILFARRSHGDGNPFDGPGNTLAHAYFPRYGGDAHFDDDERFTDNSASGVNLLQVAAHEFGHSLGLSHSEVQNALMAPFYRGYQTNFRLDADDIAGIQKIYGKKGSIPTTRDPTAPTELPTTPPPDEPTHCEIRMDAMATESSLTLGFVGSNYYRLNDQGAYSGYPRRISEDFNGLDSVDAAYANNQNGRLILFLFKGSQVYIYQYNRGRYISLGNRAISSLIRGLPGNIDALFQWPRNNKIYVFRGNQYYRLEGNTVASGYPQPLTRWNLPRSISRIGSVVQYSDRQTYFFVGDKYYRFDDQRVGVANANPPYPRDAGIYWFSCGSYRDGETTPAPKEEDDFDFHVVKTADEISEGLGNNSATSSLIHSSTFICACVLSLLATRWH